MVSMKQNAFETLYGKARLYLELAQALEGSRQGDPGSRATLVELVRRYGNSQATTDTPDHAINTVAQTLAQTSYEEAKAYLSKHLAEVVRGVPGKSLEKTLLGLSPVIGFKENEKLWKAHKRHVDAKSKIKDLEGPLTSDTYDIARDTHIEEEAKRLGKLYDKMFANVDKKKRDALLSISLHSIGHDMEMNRMRGRDVETYVNIAKHRFRAMASKAKDDVEDEFKKSGDKYAQMALAVTISQQIRQALLSGDKSKEAEAYTNIFQTLVGLRGNN